MKTLEELTERTKHNDIKWEQISPVTDFITESDFGKYIIFKDGDDLKFSSLRNDLYWQEVSSFKNSEELKSLYSLILEKYPEYKQKIDETLGVDEKEEVEITPRIASILDGRCFLDLDMMTERIEAFKFMKSSTGIDMVCIGCDDHWGYINVFHDDFGKFNVEDTFSGAEINMVRENNSLVKEIPQSRFYEILFEVNTVIEEAKKREKKFKERQKYIFANL